MYLGGVKIAAAPRLVNVIIPEGESTSPDDLSLYATGTPNATLVLDGFWGTPRYQITTVPEGVTPQWTTAYYLEVTAGHWYGIRLGCIAANAGNHVRVHLQWYNSTYSYIASSLSSDPWPGDFVNRQGPTVQAPAEASFARLFFTLYGNAEATIPPAANTGYTFAGAAVAGAAYPEEINFNALNGALAGGPERGPDVRLGDVPVVAAYAGSQLLWRR